MSYPPGITLRPVTIGGATALESGEQLSLVAEIKSSRGLMWGATGWQFHALPRTIKGNDGEELSFSLPVTDLDGWRLLDNPGSAVDVSAPGSYTHTYTVKLATLQGGRAVAVRTVGPFVLPAEDLSPVDLDLMLPVGTAAGGVALVPDSWDQKLADAVTAAQNAEALVAPTFTATTETGAPGSQADVTLTSPEPGEWNLHFVTPTGAVGPSSDEDTLPNMVNLRPNPLFTLDTNSDGIPDGYGKGGTLAAWTPSLLTEHGPSGGRVLRGTFTGTGPSMQLTHSLPSVVGNLHFFAAWVRTTVLDATAMFYAGNADITYVSVLPTGTWQLVAAIAPDAESPVASLGVRCEVGFQPGDVVDLSGPIRIDLTAAFGAGREPSLDTMMRLVTATGCWEGRYGVAESDAVARAAVAPVIEPGRQIRARSGLIRVGIFNCASYRNVAFGARAFMEHIDADVWCMQEMSDYIDQSDPRAVDRVLGAPFLPYRHWSVSSPEHTPGVDKGWLTAANTPLRNSTWTTVPSQGVQRSEILHNGRVVAVYNIHLPSSQSLSFMTNAVNALFAFVDADPTPLKIVAGDWNTPDTPHIGPPVDDSALNAFTSAGWTHLQDVLGWENTRADSSAPDFYGDNIMVTPGLQIIDGGVGPSGRMSDHRPAWADITFA